MLHNIYTDFKISNKITDYVSHYSPVGTRNALRIEEHDTHTQTNYSDRTSVNIGKILKLCTHEGSGSSIRVYSISHKVNRKE